MFEPESTNELTTPIRSEIVKIIGLLDPAQISIVGGSYSINNNPFTDTPGVVYNNDEVRGARNKR